jgi:hypothetical protein
MLRLPTSSAEILAAAKRAPSRPIRPRTPETDAFKNHLSVFSAKPTLTNDETTTPTLPTQFGPANVHPISNLRFLDPVTCHTLEAALEIEEMRKDDEDLFEDDLDTWVFHFNSYVMQSISYPFYYPRPQ